MSLKAENLSSPRKILVIDDNVAIHGDIRRLLHRRRADDLTEDEQFIFGGPLTPHTLLQHDYEIDSATSGQEGLALLKAASEKQTPYQMAFVDMRMPNGWDGLETIKQFWALEPGLQVVICTAYSEYSWEQIVQQLGFSDRLLILKKPFDNLEVCQLAAALTERWATNQRTAEMIRQIRDEAISRARESARKKGFDDLTGLPDRMLLIDRLDRMIAQSNREAKKKAAVLFLDFDRFNVVNESLGHGTGDKLLVEISGRLAATLRTTDTVALAGHDESTNPDESEATTAARVGGDEFVLLLDNIREDYDAVRVAERLLVVLSEPYIIDGHTIHTSASIGITTMSSGYQDSEAMLRDANIALHHAKTAGKARYMVFDQKMHVQAMTRLTLEHDLRIAVAQKQFKLQYQPLINLSDNSVRGFEALLRWPHPQRGLVSPAEFVPLAEEIGQITQLGEWVIREACRQFGQWRRTNPEFANRSVSVNLSRKQLGSPSLLDVIQNALDENGLTPDSLKLEITESAIMDNHETAVNVLHQIHAMGIELHMDDFGTGYSSLSCLHQFPLRELKIDRSFIQKLGKRPEHAAIVKAIITLAHNLNIEVVAEGVETIDNVHQLRAMGCDIVQGYFFAKPLDPADAEKFTLGETRALAA